MIVPVVVVVFPVPLSPPLLLLQELALSLALVVTVGEELDEVVLQEGATEAI